jgi:Spy/CpxP family protein refolding chaperone
MKTTHTTKTIVIAAVVLMAGATFAFAHGGWGNNGYGNNGHMMGPGYSGHMMGPGYGGHMMGPGGGRGYHRGDSGLSDEARAKIDAARDKFYDETRSLRRDIDDKAYDLNKEMDKENPDANKVAELQKQLSKLETEFDQKAVQHRLEMRKLLPEDAQGSGRGYYGRGGNCWQD